MEYKIVNNSKKCIVSFSSRFPSAQTFKVTLLSGKTPASKTPRFAQDEVMPWGNRIFIKPGEAVKQTVRLTSYFKFDYDKDYTVNFSLVVQCADASGYHMDTTLYSNIYSWKSEQR